MLEMVGPMSDAQHAGHSEQAKQALQFVQQEAFGYVGQQTPANHVPFT